MLPDVSNELLDRTCLVRSCAKEKFDITSCYWTGFFNTALYLKFCVAYGSSLYLKRLFFSTEVIFGNTTQYVYQFIHQDRAKLKPRPVLGYICVRVVSC